MVAFSLVPRAFLLVAFVLSLASFSHAMECSSYWDCSYKENCVGGTCTYDYLFCKDNYECEYYQTCNQGINMCQTSDGYCLSDSDCYDGKFCDVYHQCLERYDSSKPDEYSCKKDSDCQTGNICYKNVCIEDDPMDIWELLFGWLF